MSPQTTVQVLARAAWPTAANVLAARRMLFACRISDGPEPVAALVRNVGGQVWRSALLDDLAALQAVMHRELGDMPSPHADPAEWERLWIRFPAQWRSLVGRFLKVSAEAVRNTAQFHEIADDPPQQLQFACADCGKQFGTKRGLWLHEVVVHQRVAAAAFYARGSICPVCKYDFRTRPRLITHLTRGSLRCVLACKLGTVEPMTQDEHVAETVATAAAWRDAKSRGASLLVGLPCIPEA